MWMLNSSKLKNKQGSGDHLIFQRKDIHSYIVSIHKEIES